MGADYVSGTNNNNSGGGEYLSPEQFSEVSGLSLATIHRYLANGRLPKVQPGGKRCRVLIPRSALSVVVNAAESLTIPPPVGPVNHLQPTRVLSGATPRWMQRQH